MSDPAVGGAIPRVGDAADLAARRRRLDEIFGSVLPDQTRDDDPDAREAVRSGESTGQRAESARDDAWLREQVPPHHG